MFYILADLIAASLIAEGLDEVAAVRLRDAIERVLVLAREGSYWHETAALDVATQTRRLRHEQQELASHIAMHGGRDLAERLVAVFAGEGRVLGPVVTAPPGSVRERALDVLLEFGVAPVPDEPLEFAPADDVGVLVTFTGDTMTVTLTADPLAHEFRDSNPAALALLCSIAWELALLGDDRSWLATERLSVAQDESPQEAANTLAEVHRDLLYARWLARRDSID
jgi:hypothetical protein